MISQVPTATSASKIPKVLIPSIVSSGVWLFALSFFIEGFLKSVFADQRFASAGEVSRGLESTSQEFHALFEANRVFELFGLDLQIE